MATQGDEGKLAGVAWEGGRSPQESHLTGIKWVYGMCQVSFPKRSHASSFPLQLSLRGLAGPEAALTIKPSNSDFANETRTSEHSLPNRCLRRDLVAGRAGACQAHIGYYWIRHVRSHPFGCWVQRVHIQYGTENGFFFLFIIETNSLIGDTLKYYGLEMFR